MGGVFETIKKLPFMRGGHTASQHKKYWQDRDIDWKEAYFDTWNHPHRDLIIEKLKHIRFGSILEVGCASGPNLYRIQQVFTNIQLGGTDINKEAIATAKQLLHKNCILEVMSADDLFFGDGSADVVLSDMVLIYGNGRKIIKELKRVVRNDIILVEFHSKSWLKRLLFYLVSGYHAYDYEKLLKKFGFYDIEIEKIPEDKWPGGEPQKSFGYIITAKR